jgi:hypothetical protein
MLSRLPTGWDVELVVVRTPKLPSRAQLDTALSGSAIAPDSVRVMDFDAAVARVRAERPELLIVSTIGPVVDLLTGAVLDRADWRPVVVTGLPGIALPERRRALVFRSQADLMVLHSVTEVRRFRAVARRNGIEQDFALATLPFLLEAERGSGTDIVFAAQAIVPRRRDERVRLLGWLVELATRQPEQRVVVKVRAVPGEEQTHSELYSYPELLDELYPDAPANLVVEGGPMHAHLGRAAGLVTVSSTAAIEAIAHGVPALVLDEFGVNQTLLNEVFEGSGLLGGRTALLARDFRIAEPAWLSDNYFHGVGADTWLIAVRERLEQAAAGTLPVRPRIERGSGGALRRAWYRRRALGRHDRSLLGVVALLVGTPARAAVLGIRSLASLTADRPPAPLALDDEPANLSEKRQQSPHAS